MQSTSPGGRSLRLILEQAGDRVSHRVEIMAVDGGLLAELRSVEGTSADSFPPSPPLQSCSVEEIRPGLRAAFLVGMAGKGHWSASMEAMPGQAAFTFDFACRVPADAAWLGTTYRILGTSASFRSQDAFQSAALALEVEGAVLSVRAEPPSGTPTSLRFEDRLLEIACDMSSSSLGPRTFRWRYCLSLADGP